MHWPLLLFLKSFSSAWYNSYVWTDRLDSFPFFLPFLFLFDFIEHERIEIPMSFFEQTLWKKNELHKSYSLMNHPHHPSTFYWVTRLNEVIYLFFGFLTVKFFFFFLFNTHIRSQRVGIFEYVDKLMSNLR